MKDRIQKINEKFFTAQVMVTRDPLGELFVSVRNLTPIDASLLKDSVKDIDPGDAINYKNEVIEVGDKGAISSNSLYRNSERSYLLHFNGHNKNIQLTRSAVNDMFNKKIKDEYKEFKIEHAKEFASFHKKPIFGLSKFKENEKIPDTEWIRIWNWIEINANFEPKDNEPSLIVKADKARNGLSKEFYIKDMENKEFDSYSKKLLEKECQKNNSNDLSM